MKAMFFLGECKAVVKEVPVPVPKPGQVLVKMKAAGICGSDLHGIYERPKTEIEARNRREGREVIPGHEPCGIVEALGTSVRGIDIGERVLICISETCGVCKWCRMGWYNFCKKRRAYGWGPDGCFADYMVVEDRNCVRMPPWLSFEVGSHLTCGGGTVYSALKRLNISTDDTALAVGLGPVGLGGIAVMKAWGAHVIGVDIVEERVKLAKDMGADEVINAKQEDVLSRINELTDGEGVNVAVDFSGSPAGRNNCIDAVGIYGRVAFVGERNETIIDPSRQLFGKRVTIYGSRSYGIHELVELVEFMERHRINLEKMITHRFPLEKGPEALELFRSARTGKVVLTWP